jgi:predicted alpha/beta superfamily hydrolase
MKQIKLLALFIFVAQNVWAQYPLTNKFELDSKSNKTHYTIEVSVPENYNASKKYPFYYILDGYYSAAMAHGAHRVLQLERLIEDVVVVTITGPEKTTSEWLINRWPDYTFTVDTLNDVGAAKYFNLPAGSLHSGKGDAFLKTLTQEIFPLVEGKYGFNGDRGISGHSLSGQYVAYLMFGTKDLFKRFAINSSSQRLWLQNEIRRIEAKYAEAHKSYAVRTFLSYGSLEPKDGIEDLRDFERVLKTHYQDMQTQFVEFADETHVSVTPAMTTRAMWFLYKKK